MKKLLLFPCNGNAIEAIDCASTKYQIVGFIDDTKEKQKQTVVGVPVFDRSALEKFPDASILAVPGGPKSFQKREEIIASLQLDEKRFVTIIHPQASISEFAQIGTNCLIMSNVTITATAKIGSNVCILPGSIIHHDSKVGDYSIIGASVVIAGRSQIGRGCYIGSGSNIINDITIGDHCLIGLGSNVIKSISNNLIYAGNPAKIIKR